jgi:prolyl-tRNA editing enzyme YbaK/EbsC (Cys-tRNA(Pro) deacylase)
MHVFGYRRGCIGPVGLRRQEHVSIIVDMSLMEEKALLCGAGALHRVVALCPRTLIALDELNVKAQDIRTCSQ